MQYLDDDYETSNAQKYFHKTHMIYQRIIDRVTPYLVTRWLIAVSLIVLYMGFYMITYALGIYYLNLLLGFLSPKFNPQTDKSALPRNNSDEYRPFLRKFPELKVWVSAMRSIILAILCTFFSFLDIEVFWPILLVYFIILVCLTMRRQILHMIKYNYVPIDYGKPHYLQKESKINFVN